MLSITCPSARFPRTIRMEIELLRSIVCMQIGTVLYYSRLQKEKEVTKI